VWSSSWPRAASCRPSAWSSRWRRWRATCPRAWSTSGSGSRTSTARRRPGAWRWCCHRAPARGRRAAGCRRAGRSRRGSPTPGGARSSPGVPVWDPVSGPRSPRSPVASARRPSSPGRRWPTTRR
jgi:hypothetical protein